MLSEKQIKEIKNHLDRAQNPVFFFDNDQDGLCSFLLLQRFIGRGKGVVIKSFPALDENYFRKVDELGADYVFILDKPVVSEEFFERLKQRNIPTVWIDHHQIDSVVPNFVYYYNPCKAESSCEPVTRLCYQVVNQKKDLWLAVIGCIADGHLPDFYDDFLKDYPELGIKTDDAFEVLYSTKIGEIAKILSHGLKDTTTNVVKMIRLLIKANSPYVVLEENSKTYGLHKRANYLQKRYERIFSKAKEVGKNSSKLLFFSYGGDISVSGEIANQLKYLFPEKYICVCYVNGSKVNLSLRGKNVKDIFLKSIEGIESAGGGGHIDAVGGQMQSKDLDEFRKNLEEEIQ